MSLHKKTPAAGGTASGATWIKPPATLSQPSSLLEQLMVAALDADDAAALTALCFAVSASAADGCLQLGFDDPNELAIAERYRADLTDLLSSTGAGLPPLQRIELHLAHQVIEALDLGEQGDGGGA